MALPSEGLPSRGISLFTGIAGLDLGIALAFPGARPLLYVEREIYVAQVLVARIEEGLLPDAPILSDVRELDGNAWRGRVDYVCAGWPCPPVSTAGKRGGDQDARWLWPEVARVLRETEVRWFMGENVDGLLRTHAGREFAGVVSDLDVMGYDVQWGVLGAADVGAPHRRRRVFILGRRRDEPGLVHERELPGMADPDGDGRFQDISGTVGRTTGPIVGGGSGTLADPTSGGTDAIQLTRLGGSLVSKGEILADSEGDLRGAPGDGGSESLDRRGDRSLADSVGLHRTVSAPGAAGRSGGEVVAGAGRGRDMDDPDGAGSQGREDGPGFGTTDELDLGAAGPPLWPPGPNDRAEWGRIIARWPELAPATIEPGVRDLVDELSAGVGRPVAASREDKLRALGNAVVPACAALAFTDLFWKAVERARGKPL